MNYKLAKQLKDEGFPQRKVLSSYILPPNADEKYRHIMDVSKPQGYENLLAAGYDIVACPTLSELIESCGDKFFGIFRRDKKNWIASISDKNETEGLGKSPEVAVAKLWLKLNK